MSLDWQLRESGPIDALHTVLLLPGGLCGPASYSELMTQPALAHTRLIAAALPGHAGAPPPSDYSIANYARLACELAARVSADVVAGFSIGASVALEMAASGGFTGHTMLLGISLSSADEPAFFHAIVGLGSVLGSLPATLLAKGAESMVKKMPVSSSVRPSCAATWAGTCQGTYGGVCASTAAGYAVRNLMPNGCAGQAPRP